MSIPTEDQENQKGPERSGRESALIIAGPTASGKSAMAMDVAERFRGTVINADSQQVYSELREVSARPSIADEARVPHRLFGVMSGADVCSAGRWLEMAVAEIRIALDDDRLPVLVGGTGMYLQSLIEGLSPIPDIPTEVRARAQARYDEIGAEAFHAELSEMDPAAGERLPVGDTQRLLRAWEVTTHTGRAFSDWRDEPRIKPLPDVTFATIALVPPRDKLYAGIDARFARMVEEGALDEIRDLLALNLDPGLPVMKALGVPELAAYVRGEMDLESAISKAQQVSRNYAKRQLTWVRNQIKDAHVVSAQYSQSFCEEIFSFVHRFLLTGKA